MISSLCFRTIPSHTLSSRALARLVILKITKISSTQPRQISTCGAQWDVDKLRKERERLKTTTTNVLNEIKKGGSFPSKEEIASLLELSKWKFLPLIDLNNLDRSIQPKDFNTKSKPEMFFLSQERLNHTTEFLQLMLNRREDSGFVLSGPNGVGKSELLLFWASLCIAADIPVLYEVRGREYK